MATSTIKALNTVGSVINITDQDTTYFSKLAFRKIGRVVYFMSRAIKTNATISTTSGITLGTVPDNIKPIDTVIIPMYNRNSATFGELMIDTDGIVTFTKRSGTFEENTYSTVTGYCYISAS